MTLPVSIKLRPLKTKSDKIGQAIETLENGMYLGELALEDTKNGLESVRAEIAGVKQQLEHITFTQAEAAGFLEVSRMTVHRWLKAGKLKSLKATDVISHKRKDNP